MARSRPISRGRSILSGAGFPSWLRAIAHALPFASIVKTPIDVWLGKHHGAELVGILALQPAWELALLGLGRVTLRLGAWSIRAVAFL